MLRRTEGTVSPAGSAHTSALWALTSCGAPSGLLRCCVLEGLVPLTAALVQPEEGSQLGPTAAKCPLTCVESANPPGAVAPPSHSTASPRNNAGTEDTDLGGAVVRASGHVYNRQHVTGISCFLLHQPRTPLSHCCHTVVTLLSAFTHNGRVTHELEPTK